MCGFFPCKNVKAGKKKKTSKGCWQFSGVLGLFIVLGFFKCLPQNLREIFGLFVFPAIYFLLTDLWVRIPGNMYGN